MLKNYKRVFLFVILPFCCNCSYLENRFSDFIDIARLEARTGAGLNAGVKVGGLAHLGLGTSDSSAYGLWYGNFAKEHEYFVHCPPLSFIIMPGHGNPPYFIMHYEGHSSESYLQDGFAHTEHACPGILPLVTASEPRIKSTLLKSMDIEVDLFVGVVGFNAGISPIQATDFLLGFLGIDLAGDDAPAKISKEDNKEIKNK